MALAARFDRFGPASVISVVEVTPPHPGPGEARVRVKAVGLNPVDYKMRQGTSRHSVTFPSGVGRELAGVVDEIGDGVTSLKVGDDVFGTVHIGALADYALVPAANLASKPAELDWTVAGSLALAGQTAYDSFASQAVTSADTVLVSAAAGGVGSIVAQLAARAGATVIGTAGPSNQSYLASLGVIPVLYGPGLAGRVRAAAPTPVTVVFDHHGPETIEAALELGVDRSRINTIAMDPAVYSVCRVGRGAPNIATLDTLAGLVVDGELTIAIDSTYPLSELVAAFEHLEAGHLRGKVVVVV
ncbi:NADP-dependent oxidoreductase [Parafrigoribacterium mesophilum]|uniref:NADP-dependent oxidoreductase n=1 Tax=Parafrigoribacterium mesophilum TaxID=433646 RepID=UPI0031FBDB24